jgi:hypothetical protein
LLFNGIQQVWMAVFLYIFSGTVNLNFVNFR